jgi:hypothetical protein
MGERGAEDPMERFGGCGQRIDEGNVDGFLRAAASRRPRVDRGSDALTGEGWSLRLLGAILAGRLRDAAMARLYDLLLNGKEDERALAARRREVPWACNEAAVKARDVWGGLGRRSRAVVRRLARGMREGRQTRGSEVRAVAVSASWVLRSFAAIWRHHRTWEAPRLDALFPDGPDRASTALVAAVARLNRDDLPALRDAVAASAAGLCAARRRAMLDGKDPALAKPSRWSAGNWSSP